MEHDYSLSDIRAATDHDNDGMWGGDGAWWILILFFLFLGGGWNGNRNENVATDAALQRGFDTQTIVGKLNGITNGLCDGFYAMNTGLLNGFNGVQRDLCQGFNGINQNINQARFDAQQCCCETNRNIDAVRAENYKNTCEIVNAVRSDGEATRALINSNTMQALRDKLEDKDRELQTANFQLSQQAQNATLIGALRPFPQPAYITCSPYTAQNGFGCAGRNSVCSCA